jgi:type II secretory pathway predicted ATPase ExeA
MYKSFFGLRLAPFGPSPDPRFLCMVPAVREALACLQYGIATVLKTVLSTFQKGRVSSAFVFNPRLDVLDFLEFVLTDFGIPPKTRTKSGMLLQLNHWLVERFRERGLCVIVVDEAQNLSWDLLEEIRLLTNLESSSEKLLQIVLSGQPELAEKLRHPSVRQLRQRISVWCRTQPLSWDQTQTYISERLRIAGATDSVFAPKAIQAVHRYSNGIPRIINLICEHALISAYVEQIKPIPAKIVESVSIELDLDQQSFMISNGSASEISESPISTAIPSGVSPHAESTATVKDNQL